MSYEVRAATADEVQLAVDLAAAEGWNPGLHDARAFRAADPAGFLVGVLDGEPIATCSAVRYDWPGNTMRSHAMIASTCSTPRGVRPWRASGPPRSS